MRAVSNVIEPKEVEIEIVITATLEEWEIVRKELETKKWTSVHFGRLIRDSVAKMYATTTETTEAEQG